MQSEKRSPSHSSGYVYIVRCVDDTLYIGSTNDLEKRLHAHNHLKRGARYTKTRRPVSLVYSELLETINAAKTREAALKKLSRKEKLALIHEAKMKRKKNA